MDNLLHLQINNDIEDKGQRMPVFTEEQRARLQKMQRVNKCITAQITDFELAILAQANDKWKPITLADGAFDLDELKRDISAADSKFSVRKYKPTALILEYLVSRAAKQGVSVPAFVANKPPSVKKRRTPEDEPTRGVKRFRPGRSRPLYSMDQDTWEDEGYEEDQDANWEIDITKRRILHIRTQQIGVTRYTHRRAKGHLQAGDIPFFS
jgi:hypothetical protein